MIIPYASTLTFCERSWNLWQFYNPTQSGKDNQAKVSSPEQPFLEVTSVVLPMFQRSVFCPLRSLQASWGPGMPSTYYLLPGKEYNLCMQDTSDATSKRCSLVSQHQRTSTSTGRDLSRGSTVRSVPIWDSSDAEKNPCLVSDESSKTMSSIQALANTRLEWLVWGVNWALWNVHHKVTPTTLTGKLGVAATLGGAAAAAAMALLGTLLASVAGKKDKERV